MRIVYVEDNMVNLALVERIAKMGGHTVISYADGSEALEALSSIQTDLILMDIELDGELKGTVVTEKLRERGDTRPIVAVTAYAMAGDMERIMASGFDAYLPKPVPIAELLQIIARFDPSNEQPSAPTDAAEPASPPAVPSTSAAPTTAPPLPTTTESQTSSVQQPPVPSTPAPVKPLIPSVSSTPPPKPMVETPAMAIPNGKKSSETASSAPPPSLSTSGTLEETNKPALAQHDRPQPSEAVAQPTDVPSTSQQKDEKPVQQPLAQPVSMRQKEQQHSSDGDKKT